MLVSKSSHDGVCSPMKGTDMNQVTTAALTKIK